MNHYLTIEEFLNETTKIELIQNALLDRVDRAKRVKVTFDSARFNKKGILILEFESIDPNGKAGHSWSQRIHVLDILKDEMSKKVLKKALSGNLKVYCDCPDFLYKGFKYIATNKGYNIESEDRAPKIRNPDEEGTVCKHVIGVLNNLDKFVNKIHGDLE